MAYKVMLECPQTQVGDHSAIGYVSGDRLPVGHPDVGADWRPVVVEVDEPEPAPTPQVAKPASTPVSPPAATPGTGITGSAKTGVKQP